MLPKTLQIGNITIRTPFVQAALSGYSDGPMRRIARRLGAPYCIHEVVLDKLVVQGGKLQRRTLNIADDDHPVGGQLMGAEPDQFAEAAAMMATGGYDIIDINFGCPVKKVLGRCRGGFLLSDPPTAKRIIRRVRDAVPADVPVTLKMRRAMDDTPEAERDFFEIFDYAFACGLAAITVHGRTVKQRYIGPSNWDFLARLKRHAGDRTLLGSGDLFTAEDCVRMLDRTGVDGVTIARGCIGNPWIFAEAEALLRGRPLPPPPSVPEQGRVIREHYDLVVEEYGERKAGQVMRKFGIKYSELHPDFDAVRDAFIRCRHTPDWHAVLDEWYAPDKDWPAPTRRGVPSNLVAAGASLCGE